jgi:hypothetical protein
LASYESRFDVLSSRLVAGRTQVRVFAETAPDESFEPVEPNLEDVYFGTLRRAHGGVMPAAS